MSIPTHSMRRIRLYCHAMPTSQVLPDLGVGMLPCLPPKQGVSYIPDRPCAGPCVCSLLAPERAPRSLKGSLWALYGPCMEPIHRAQLCANMCATRPRISSGKSRRLALLASHLPSIHPKGANRVSVGAIS